MYLWAWFILTVIFTIAAVRSSWVLFLDLAFLDLVLLLLAVGQMTGNESVLLAGYGLGFVVAFFSCEHWPLRWAEMVADVMQIGLAVRVCGLVGSRRLSCLLSPCTRTRECCGRRRSRRWVVRGWIPSGAVHVLVYPGDDGKDAKSSSRN